MADTSVATPKSAGPTLFSPKLTKGKQATMPATSAGAAFGCEHVQTLLRDSKKLAIEQFGLIQRLIHSHDPLVLATPSTKDGNAVPTLRPTYLCLQCPMIITEEGQDEHFAVKKHVFFIESKSGCLFCHQCSDFVYDPTLEPVRMRRGQKRKYDEFLDGNDQRLILANSTAPPCRALGLRGLYNMGNTCYMSCIVQCLLHNPFFKTWYLGHRHKTTQCSIDACASCAFDEIFSEFYSTEKTEGYGAVSMMLSTWSGSKEMVGYQQQDAHEFFEVIINLLHTHNTAAQPNDKSGDDADETSTTASPAKPAEPTHSPGLVDCECISHNTFGGLFESKIACSACKNESFTYDALLDLSIQINKRSLALESCLTGFVSPEEMGEYRCGACGKQETSTRSMRVKRAPNSAMIHLKRFEMTPGKKNGDATFKKISLPVSFPLALDFSPYMVEPKSSSKSGAIMYDLASVMVHKGDATGGHYICYTKEEGDWFLFDDSKISLASEADVLAAEAYLLCYNIRDPVIKDLD